MSTSSNDEIDKPYLIKFEVKCTSLGPSTSIVTPALPPDVDTDSQKTIKAMYNSVSTTGITSSNSAFIEQSLTTLTNKIKTEYPDNEEIESKINNVIANSKNKDGLLWSLTQLYDAITAENIDLTLPDQDDKDGNKPTGVYFNINAPVKQTQAITVANRQSIATAVSKLDLNLMATSKNLNTLVDRLKNPGTNSQTTTNTDQTPGTASLTGQIGTSGRSRDNIFNRIAIILLRRNGVNFTETINKLRNSAGTNVTLQNFNLSQISSAMTPPTKNLRAYMYEIESSFVNNKIQVKFTYYPTNEPKYYQFTYNLSTDSFYSLSQIAFSNAKNLSDTDKTTIVKNSGLVLPSGQTVPSDNDLWSAYLIWVYSYIGFGVQSQIIRTNNFSYPNDQNFNVVNYMLRYGYLESIGNFCLSIQVAHNPDTQYAQLLSIGIPKMWSSCMYPNGSEYIEPTYKSSESSAIVSLINSYLKITPTNV